MLQMFCASCKKITFHFLYRCLDCGCEQGSGEEEEMEEEMEDGINMKKVVAQAIQEFEKALGEGE